MPFKPGAPRLPNAGRKKGVPNKATADLKAAILRALDKVGGDDYLVAVASSDPRTFCMLLAKVLPMQVTGEGGGAVTIRVVTGVPE